MTRKRHTEEQIIAVLKDAQAGVSVQDLCRKHDISDATPRLIQHDIDYSNSLFFCSDTCSWVW